MRPSHLLPLLSASLLACIAASGCGDARRVAQSEHADPIVGGTPDGDTGTVLLTHLDYGFLCSATVIAPSLVVTAKHCVMFPKNGVDTPLPGNRFIVGFGSSANALTAQVQSSKIDWIGSPGNTDVQAAVDGGYDVALVYLSQGVPQGTTIHAPKFDYQPANGDPITIVGYGMNKANGAGSSGTKLATTDSVVGWTLTGIVETQGKGACNGDSGGSFFFGPNRELVAVTSTAGASSSTTKCDVGITNGDSFGNPDVKKFVFDALQAVGVCSPEPEICGNGIDEDCDGTADDHCKFNGDPCTSDGDCKTSMCRDVGGQSVCVKPCDLATPCGSMQHCTSLCGGGFCVPGAQGSKSLGDTCTDSSQCASLDCGADDLCTLPCDTAKGQCPDDEACDDSAGCGSCAKATKVSAKRSLGEPCQSDGDCATTAGCADDGFGVKRCTEPCLEGACTKGFLCEGGKCVRGGGFALGERCRAPEECQSNQCADFGGADNFCTNGCATAADCGAGFDCKDLGGALYCQPNLAPLGKPCSSDAVCLSGFCSPSLGTCSRKCEPTKAPCPPGLECVGLDSDLYCRAAPGAFPAKDAGADTGAAGAGGEPSDAGEDAPFVQPPPDNSGSSGGCSTSPRASRSGAGLVAAAALAFALGARRRERS